MIDAGKERSETTMGSGMSANLDPAEVDRFSRIAAEWWDANGKFRPLHKLGPPRVSFLRDELLRHFRPHVAATGLKPLSGLRILDVGCGGGLVAEPLARMGAAVTAIDPSEDTIRAARAHAEPQGLAIDYRVARIEELAAESASFDAVSCLEVLEHVPDPAAFIATLTYVIRPGGLALLSTLNRTMKSYALAIVAAEYVLGWVPRGTHDWNRFITPDELSRHAAAAGLTGIRLEGLVYDPLADTWSRSASDIDVNYMASAVKPA